MTFKSPDSSLDAFPLLILFMFSFVLKLILIDFLLKSSLHRTLLTLPLLTLCVFILHVCVAFSQIKCRPW